MTQVNLLWHSTTGCWRTGVWLMDITDIPFILMNNVFCFVLFFQFLFHFVACVCPVNNCAVFDAMWCFSFYIFIQFPFFIIITLMMKTFQTCTVRDMKAPQREIKTTHNITGTHQQSISDIGEETCLHSAVPPDHRAASSSSNHHRQHFHNMMYQNSEHNTTIRTPCHQYTVQFYLSRSLNPF